MMLRRPEEREEKKNFWLLCFCAFIQGRERERERERERAPKSLYKMGGFTEKGSLEHMRYPAF
jgi:hypothetical protein